VKDRAGCCKKSTSNSSKTKEKEETHINFHSLVNTIVHNQAMSQPDTMRLHRMSCNVCIVTNVGVIEISHFWLVAAGEFRREGIERRERRHYF